MPGMATTEVPEDLDMDTDMDMDMDQDMGVTDLLDMGIIFTIGDPTTITNQGEDYKCSIYIRL